jgi:hypothetical protein
LTHYGLHVATCSTSSQAAGGSIRSYTTVHTRSRPTATAHHTGASTRGTTPNARQSELPVVTHTLTYARETTQSLHLGYDSVGLQSRVISIPTRRYSPPLSRPPPSLRPPPSSTLCVSCSAALSVGLLFTSSLLSARKPHHQLVALSARGRDLAHDESSIGLRSLSHVWHGILVERGTSVRTES